MSKPHIKIPHVLFELGLTTIQFVVYLVLKKNATCVNSCTKTTRELAEEAQVDIKSYRAARDFLCQIHPILNKPLIISIPRDTKPGGPDTNEVKIVDI